MKKGILSLLTWSLPFLLLAQINTSHGINWTEGLSWNEVLKKAKEENKYIFLDCFATWCGPCHEMDKQVYPDAKVGEAFNAKFISVKVQMDKTGYDNEIVKKWYRDAGRIQKNYTVNAFPTFLFFSPDGLPSHRAAGYRGPTEFIALAMDAMNPQKQYYALLKNYQPGKLDTSELKGLARALAKSGGDLATAMAVEYLSRIPKRELGSTDNLSLMREFNRSPKMQEVAAAYIAKTSPKNFLKEDNLRLIQDFKSVASVQGPVLKYLSNLKKPELAKQLSLLTVFNKDSVAKPIADKYINSLKADETFKKENLQLIAAFTQTSKDKGFRIFRENLDRIDKVMGSKTYAEATVKSIIVKEEYDPFYTAAVKTGTDNMPWPSIKETISVKYGSEMAEFLERHVKASLFEYFAQNKDKYWPEYIRSYIDKIEKNGYDTSHPQIQFLDVILINNFVFNAIFYHSDDKDQINTALKWMEGVIRRNAKDPNNFDTYANLLYKAGRIKEAIQWQEKAVQIASEEKSGYLPSFQSNLAKMKKGEPTWIKGTVN